MNDKWSKEDIFRTPSWSLGHVAFLTLDSSEYGPMSQRNLSWGLDSQGFMLRIFWYLVFERKSKECWHIKTLLNVETTSCVHEDSKTSNSIYHKTLIYTKIKWKKNLWGFTRGGSNQCRTQTYFRFAEIVWAPQKLSPSFLEQGL